jgi:hypothetical protein
MDIVTLEAIEAGGVTLPAFRVVSGVPAPAAEALIAGGQARAARPHEASLAGPLKLIWPETEQTGAGPAPLTEESHDA